MIWLWWRLLAFVLARYELIPAPSVDGKPGAKYLSRWHFPRWLARQYGADFLFLHYFHTGDPDRGWHCHPWDWCESRLLRGAYVQELRLPSMKRGGGPMWTHFQEFSAGERNRLTGEFHAVRLLATPVWTLFRAGPKHGRSWGFVDQAGRFWPANGNGGMQ